ncbi:MAG: Molybdopterin-guanine dinucleotide biosynthesis protein MobB [Candidatus Bathyarchaeota archaeon B24]|nr:MAG: Molybdopterin-guanine dinucleotide biosynthesis protein MobB [Candidatus Bathyarchaeota archaeon B24]
MKAKVDKRLDELSSLVDCLKGSSDEIGAIAIFIGVVRGVSDGERVLRLEFEAHEALAPKVLNRIVEEVKKKYGLIDVIAEHRVGDVPVGGDVMYVLVASKHRKEAFEALAELVDRIKHETPIWKKEVTEKGARYV